MSGCSRCGAATSASWLEGALRFSHAADAVDGHAHPRRGVGRDDPLREAVGLQQVARLRGAEQQHPAHQGPPVAGVAQNHRGGTVTSTTPPSFESAARLTAMSSAARFSSPKLAGFGEHDLGADGPSAGLGPQRRGLGVRGREQRGAGSLPRHLDRQIPGVGGAHDVALADRERDDRKRRAGRERRSHRRRVQIAGIPTAARRRCAPPPYWGRK